MKQYRGSRHCGAVAFRVRIDLSAGTIAALLLLVLTLSISASARAQSRDIQRGVGAAAGIVASIYVHELGHAAAFHAAGAATIDIDIPGSQCSLLCGQTRVSWNGPPPAGMGKAISASGLIASNLAAEALLVHEPAARSAFGQGFIAANLYSNVFHVATYYTRVRGRNGYQGNDIDSYELAGGNPHLLSAALIGYSAFALQRMHRKHIPVFFISTHF